ncbi:FtsX-like permease family protein [Paenibacillus sp. chi10]|uniref:FtsX-like permease family protein n=1 Tax=Paenibacillus suaedae TaxID=3077233 RepID=A0AAJ2JZK1_9BACL|nr:FtsX-like permease family protein [Paenibacillus sp. chi10]MDT8977364.1 FtsX-like permease family protein [Paenibacillus sp. chi10]
MKNIIKIAFRNILAKKKRSILIGLAIWLSLFLLMTTDAIMNGAQKQVSKSYVNLQSGDVAVIWENTKKVKNSDPSRLLAIQAFEAEKKDQNQQAISRLETFVKDHSEEIQAYYPTIIRNAQMTKGNTVDTAKVFSLTPQYQDMLLASETVKMDQGVLLSDQPYSICISADKAKANHLKLGDKVTFEAITPDGTSKSLDFVITGIYSNMAIYDNKYSFMSYNNAKELFDFESGYFDVGRIFLKHPDQRGRFAETMDQYLTSESPILRAESSEMASSFFTNTSTMLKASFEVFVVFFLCVIALGIYSTIKMNLFGRMKEFGTIRAIGYSRFQSFLIIFFEFYFLSIIAMVAALIMVVVLVLIVGNTGIYLGSGAITTVIGGERIYPVLKVGDTILAFLIITLFTIISSGGPGLKLCYQNITDLMLKRQRKISLFSIFFRSIFPGSEPKSNQGKFIGS